MTPQTLILDTSVLIAGLRSSRGASYALLSLVNIRNMAEGAARYGIEVIRPGEALRRLGVGE